MNRKKAIAPCIIIVLSALLCIGSSSCEEDPQDRADRLAVNAQQEQYRQNQPIHRYNWSIELDAYQQIYDARVEGTISTWTVIRSNTGMILDDFASLGFPIPYDVQLTNPLKMVDMDGGGGVTIEQPEPNGLYSSKTTVATWVRVVLIIDGRSVVVPFYSEDKVSCYAYPINVDYTTNRVTPVPGVVPSIEIKDNRPDNLKE